MSIDSTSTGADPKASVPSRTDPPLRVVLLCKRGLQPDEKLLDLLDGQLRRNGFSVFIDRHDTLGVDWAKEIERQIRTADVVIPLLSGDSATSELLAFQIENAHDAAQKQQGRPHLLPVRVNYTGPLSEPIAGILDSIRYLLWEGPADDDRLVAEVCEALRNLPLVRPVIRISTKPLRLAPRPASQPRPSAALARSAVPSILAAGLEAVGGAVPLHSEFYLVRKTDYEFNAALARYDSVILIKGARQMGKTSLLARGLQYARDRGAKVALTDFQKLNASNLESVNALYLTLAESLADQLELSVIPSEVWDERRGPNVNFERFLRREVLSKFNAPLVWGLDEVDRLFVCSFGSEVFGLFRSWHNERALDPSGPWAGLTLAIAYATEAHLFITDMNQSPFNVGTRLSLDDFSPDQVAELNRRYRSPLANEAQMQRFVRLVGGHPFLVRRGLHELATRRISLDEFERQADRDEGIFGDHLRRMLVLLAKDPELTDVVRGVLAGKPCPTPESFYRLRSAGVVLGDTQNDARPRCRLYEVFLSRHLL